jgi:3',5'-cyclic-AMP phosphodiesterase
MNRARSLTLAAPSTWGHLRAAAALALTAVLGGCFRPGEQRAELDEKVGFASAGGVNFHVVEGLAAVRAIEAGALGLWAQAPVLSIEVASSAQATTGWSLAIRNCIQGSTVLSATGAITWQPVASDGLTNCRFQLSIPQGAVGTLRIGPADADEPSPLTFAVLSDIQNHLPFAGDIWAVMNRDPELRFVASMGDLTDGGKPQELDEFQQSIQGLAIPYYSTVGNHDIAGDVKDWHTRFGRFNFHWQMHGVHLTFLDSASAGLDPIVYGWLEDWLAQGQGSVHAVFTHYPPFDPVGTRAASFRTSAEASKFIGMLAEGGVDVVFMGHLHSYYAFSLGGIPAYISGGGGGIPETMDGIGRHYLRVVADPGKGSHTVSIVRVD